MRKMHTGTFSGVPISLLPTGYMVFVVNRGRLNEYWQDFYSILKLRQRESQEPVFNTEIQQSEWFQNMHDDAQALYSSMMTNGRHIWVNLELDTPAKKKRYANLANELEKCLLAIEHRYPEVLNSGTTAFDSVFELTDLGADSMDSNLDTDIERLVHEIKQLMNDLGVRLDKLATK